MSGKKTRLARFRCGPSHGPGIIIPIDHGLTIGPVTGLNSTEEMANFLGCPEVDGVIAHKGIIERLGQRGSLGGFGVMVHLNGMSTLAESPDTKVRFTDVETAIRLGADGVSLQVNFDGHNDADNLVAIGKVVDDAARFALPVLAMVYDKVASTDAAQRISRVRHLMRIAIELGVDAIKIAPPAELRDVPALLAGLAIDAPIYFAGGSLGSREDLFALAHSAVANGAAGLCVGRNVFQAPRPAELLTELRAVMDDTAQLVSTATTSTVTAPANSRVRPRRGLAVNQSLHPVPHRVAL